MRNKNLVVGLVVALLVLVGGYYLFFGERATKETAVTQPEVPEETILTLSPEEIGLNLTSIENNRKVLIEIENTSDLVSVDYELSYTAKGDIPRGVLGTIDVKSNKPIEHEIVLGTCSDVCHYDEDVSSIKVILKVTKSDSKVYQSEKSL